MVEKIIRQTSKKTWYKWSVYINVILFFTVAVALYFAIQHSISFGATGREPTYLLYLVADIAVIAVALSFIFFQFFRNIFIIMKRSL
jgi:hypothetical protein